MFRSYIFYVMLCLYDIDLSILSEDFKNLILEIGLFQMHPIHQLTLRKRTNWLHNFWKLIHQHMMVISLWNQNISHFLFLKNDVYEWIYKIHFSVPCRTIYLYSFSFGILFLYFPIHLVQWILQSTYILEY